MAFEGVEGTMKGKSGLKISTPADKRKAEAKMKAAASQKPPK